MGPTIKVIILKENINPLKLQIDENLKYFMKSRDNKAEKEMLEVETSMKIKFFLTENGI